MFERLYNRMIKRLFAGSSVVEQSAAGNGLVSDETPKGLVGREDVALPVAMVYRQNGFLDAIASEVEHAGVKVERLTIPAGTRTIPPELETRITAARQLEKEGRTRLYFDGTMNLLLNTLQKNDFRALVGNYAVEDSPDGYRTVIEMIGEDMRGHNLEEAVVVLSHAAVDGTLDDGRGSIFDHDFNTGRDQHSYDADCIPEQRVIERAREFHDAYRFIEKALATLGVKAKPGIFTEPDELKAGRCIFFPAYYSFENIEDLVVDQSESDVLRVNGALVFAPSSVKQAVILDRHTTPCPRRGVWDGHKIVDEEVVTGFSRSYIKHEGPTFAACDQGSSSYGQALDIIDPGVTMLSPTYKDGNVVKAIAEKIVADAKRTE